MADSGEVVAAGAVVWRRSDQGPQVLLIHRPKYDDWSFPKGKVDRDEHVLVAAVREVLEETAVRVRIGAPLPTVRYQLDGGRSKTVYYWHGTPTPAAPGDEPFTPMAEVDDVTWLPVEDARRRLTHERDRQLLDALIPRPSTPLIVLRHAEALERRRWSGPDPERPLTENGKGQADRLVAIFGAYGVREVITSPAVRCVETVRPYADLNHVPIRTEPSFAEEASAAETTDRARALRAARVPTVWCAHRPTMPLLADALGVQPFALTPGNLLVFHREASRDTYAATETHAP